MVVLKESFAPARWGRRPRPACPAGPAARLGMGAEVILMTPCIFCTDDHSWDIQGDAKMTLTSTARRAVVVRERPVQQPPVVPDQRVADASLVDVDLRCGRIATLRYCPSTSHQIHKEIRWLYF